jgi:hypothetical protein
MCLSAHDAPRLKVIFHGMNSVIWVKQSWKPISCEFYMLMKFDTLFWNNFATVEFFNKRDTDISPSITYGIHRTHSVNYFIEKYVLYIGLHFSGWLDSV